MSAADFGDARPGQTRTRAHTPGAGAKCSASHLPPDDLGLSNEVGPRLSNRRLRRTRALPMCSPPSIPLVGFSLGKLVEFAQVPATLL
jgi:hypothetical protein